MAVENVLGAWFWLPFRFNQIMFRRVAWQFGSIRSPGQSGSCHVLICLQESPGHIRKPLNLVLKFSNELKTQGSQHFWFEINPSTECQDRVSILHNAILADQEWPDPGSEVECMEICDITHANYNVIKNIHQDTSIVICISMYIYIYIFIHTYIYIHVCVLMCCNVSHYLPLHYIAYTCICITSQHSTPVHHRPP